MSIIAGREPGGGDSHMKQTGMLIVSLRGVNFEGLVSLRVLRAKTQYFKPSKFPTSIPVCFDCRFVRNTVYFRKWNKEVEVSVINLHFHENNELHCLRLGLSVPDESLHIKPVPRMVGTGYLVSKYKAVPTGGLTTRSSRSCYKAFFFWYFWWINWLSYR